MVLKDVTCSKCGMPSEAVMRGEETSLVKICPRCDRAREHRSICNGGMKGERYRCNDWSGWDPEGHVEFLGVRAGFPRNPGSPDESKDFEPLRSAKGDIVHERVQFSEGARADRREKNRALRRVKKYGKRVFHDGKRPSVTA